jgi:hypothetical protein
MWLKKKNQKKFQKSLSSFIQLTLYRLVETLNHLPPYLSVVFKFLCDLVKVSLPLFCENMPPLKQDKSGNLPNPQGAHNVFLSDTWVFLSGGSGL